MLSHLDMEMVREHYLKRKEIHEDLLHAFKKDEVEQYVELTLGITDPSGNYSASEHRLGPKILERNDVRRDFELAKELNRCTRYSAKRIPEIVASYELKYLKISVGSEMSMMLHPETFWVSNVRTVWAHLLIKHGDNYEELMRS